MSSEGSGVSSGREKSNAMQSSVRQMDALRGCLLEGDAEQTQRERKVRRRALVTSTLLQAAVLLAVIAVPFFGKVERIALANVMPIPPYRPYNSGVRQHTVSDPQPAGARHTFCLFCPATPAVRPAGTGNDHAVGDSNPLGDPEDPGVPCTGCIDIVGKGPIPKAPNVITARPAIVKFTHIDPAMLIERVEPVYPTLAKQTRRSGRVELHAIISVDGRIESLEVVSGDVVFLQSALDAVRRWRYRPTMLNGQAVKVDTYITVNYTMAE
jgi:TonB family protein